MVPDAAPARMEPIATLPVFYKLAGRRVVLAGGGAPAVWKAELLSAAGACVEVFAPEPHAEIVALAAHPPGGPIRLHHRAWTPADLPGAAIALGAIEDEEEAAGFQAAARGAGVPVNVIDKPAYCDFQFGTIVSRSPLIVGISTDGAAPVFGQAIRARIEALLPQGLRAWAEAARDWRPAVQAQNLDFRARRRFWEAFAERALATPVGAPTEADRAACTTAALTPDRAPATTARLVLVGAGAGAPDAITLRAVKALQDADLVFHASDLSPVLVGFARREAVKVAVPAAWSAHAAAAFVASRLRPGALHVWLDSGDPTRCHSWAERASQLSDLGQNATTIDGVGRCGACAPGCPAWSPHRPAA